MKKCALKLTAAIMFFLMIFIAYPPAVKASAAETQLVIEETRIGLELNQKKQAVIAGSLTGDTRSSYYVYALSSDLSVVRTDSGKDIDGGCFEMGITGVKEGSAVITVRIIDKFTEDTVAEGEVEVIVKNYKKLDTKLETDCGGTAVVAVMNEKIVNVTRTGTGIKNARLSASVADKNIVSVSFEKNKFGTVHLNGLKPGSTEVTFKYRDEDTGLFVTEVKILVIVRGLFKLEVPDTAYPWEDTGFTITGWSYVPDIQDYEMSFAIDSTSAKYASVFAYEPIWTESSYFVVPMEFLQCTKAAVNNGVRIAVTMTNKHNSKETWTEHAVVSVSDNIYSHDIIFEDESLYLEENDTAVFSMTVQGLLECQNYNIIRFVDEKMLDVKMVSASTLEKYDGHYDMALTFEISGLNSGNSDIIFRIVNDRDEIFAEKTVNVTVDYASCIAGDANNDGRIDIIDLTLIKKWLMTSNDTASYWQNADVFKDNKIDVYDLVMLKHLMIS